MRLNCTVIMYSLFVSGCRWHAHDKPGCRNGMLSPYKDTAPERDRAREQYLTQRGISIQCIWECEFDKLVAQTPELKDTIQSFYPKFYSKHRGKVTSEQILNAVSSGEFFGILLVDVFLPHGLRPKFEPYPGLFANTTIEYSQIGTYMQNYVDRNDIRFKSRRLLITGHQGENLLMTSDLLRWYINHGFQVTYIHQCVESVPDYPFKSFAEDVEQMRRRADHEPGHKIRSNLAKLIG